MGGENLSFLILRWKAVNRPNSRHYKLSCFRFLIRRRLRLLRNQVAIELKDEGWKSSMFHKRQALYFYRWIFLTFHLCSLPFFPSLSFFMREKKGGKVCRDELALGRMNIERESEAGPREAAGGIDYSRGFVDQERRQSKAVQKSTMDECYALKGPISRMVVTPCHPLRDR